MQRVLRRVAFFIAAKRCWTRTRGRCPSCANIILFHSTSLDDKENVDHACRKVSFFSFSTTKKTMKSPAVICEYNRSKLPFPTTHSPGIPAHKSHSIPGISDNPRAERVAPPPLPLTLFFLRVSLLPSGEKWANQSAAADAEWMKEGGESSQRTRGL